MFFVIGDQHHRSLADIVVGQNHFYDLHPIGIVPIQLSIDRDASDIALFQQLHRVGSRVGLNDDGIKVGGDKLANGMKVVTAISAVDNGLGHQSCFSIANSLSFVLI